jgi:hypothetical protein
MAVYLELFHGRHDPEEDLDDWGFDGPVIGPLPFFHMTYGSHIKMGDPLSKNQGTHIEELGVDENGLVMFQGAWYGDVSVFDRQTLNKEDRVKKRWEETKKIMSLPDSELPLYINDDRDWIRIYVEKKLKGDL